MALTRITKGVIKPNENYDTHNINSTGIVTATKFVGPFDSINVSGAATFTGNVTIGGTLTYEDVTNVDSVGIITAQSDIHVGAGVSIVGILTASTIKSTNLSSDRVVFTTSGGQLEASGNLTYDGSTLASGSPFDLNADLDVDGHTNLDNVSVAGVTTFSGGVTVNSSLDLNGDIDVDGHTNLDNVNIAGVTTSGNLTINGDLTVNDNYPSIYLKDYDSDSDFMIQNQNGIFTIYDSTNNADRFEITSSGTVRSQHYEVRSQSPSVSFTDTNHDSDYMWQNANGLFKIYDNTNGADRFAVNSSGSVFVYGNELYIGDSIIHHGDSDTKIRFPSNDTIQFETGSINRLYASNSGVYVQSGLPLAFLASSGPTPNIKSGGTNNQDLLFTTGSGNPTRIHIKSNGNIGIGTDNPSAKIEIAPKNDGAPYLRVKNHTSAGAYTGNYGSEFRHTFNSTNHAMLIHTQEAADARRVLDISDSNGIFATFTNGKVGIGTIIPDTKLEIGNAIGTGTANLLKLTSYTNSQNSRPALVFWNNNPNTAQAQISAKGGASYNASKLHFSVANSSRVLQDRACIDEFGTFIIGPGDTRRNTKGSNQHQVLLIEGTGNNSTRMSMIRNSNDDNGPEIQLIKTRGTSVGSVTKPNQNDYIGSLTFMAGDDTDLFARGADIAVVATGTPANDRVPCDILFSTTPTSGASSPQERFRIASDGVATFSATNINVNRNAGDAFISLQTSGTSNVALYGGASSGFRVFTKPSGGSLNERLSITNDGQLIQKADKASGYVAEFHQDNTSNSAQILIDSPTNSASRPSFIELSRAGTLQWSFGQGYNNSVGAFHFATSTLGSGVTGSKFSIEADGDISIPTVGAKIYTNNSGGNLTIQGGATYPGSAIKFNGGANGGTGVMHFYAGQASSYEERMTIKSDGKIGMSQSSPNAATLHIGNSVASSGSNVALQVGTISGQNRYLTINHFSNQQNFYQMKMRVNDNGLIPMLDMGNPYGSNGHGTAINFHGYQDSKVGAIESVNTANNSTSSVDMVLRTGAAPKEVLRLQSGGDARFYNGLTIAKVDNDNSGFSKSGYVLGTPAYTEYHYTWSGQSSYTIDLTCASYFSCIWEYFQHQTNGGSRMQQYARGKWSNNHYQHTLNVWEWSGSGGGLSVSFTASDQGGGGSINGLSNMSNNGSTYSGFVNGGGESNSTTANGRFRISETYNWGSVSSRALIVRVSYGSFNMSKS